MSYRLTASFTLIAAALVAFAADEFPTPKNSEPKAHGEPMAALDAAAGFKVPDGFRVNVFAAEPDVRNPIACAWDTRGRLWVAENFTYAERGTKFELAYRDRILIFADLKGEGVAQKPIVFANNLQRLTSVEVGLGGVWAMCPPQLLFIPDKDGDDKPDGKPEVVLEGFDVPAENYHNFANGLKWGPDGWLYGRCGASAPGKVRRPDQGPEAEIPLAGGIWRYHPKTKVFEPLCHGTTNPWGHDWDAKGECFFINTVNGHFWHMIPGAHCRRPHTMAPNPLVYEPLEMHADHWHFDLGKGWNQEAVNASRELNPTVDKLGGGHAHVGGSIYLGTQWPKEYQGRFLTLNMHGRRTNVERIERFRSGFVGKHDPDMLFASDKFFRATEITYGPDGSGYILDWSDAGECHEHNGVHRTSGRIYRVTFGKPKPTPAPDLRKKSNLELADLHTSENEWLVRMARRELADRVEAGKPVADAVQDLTDMLRQSKNVTHRIRAMGTVHALGQSKPRNLLNALILDEYTRSCAVRLLTDDSPLDTVHGVSRVEGTKPAVYLFDSLAQMAKDEKSAFVRLTLASTLQRIPVADRPKLGAALASHEEDADDPNIPFLIWYGLIPVARDKPELLVEVAASAKIPKIRRWSARRFAELIAKEPKLLDSLLSQTAKADETVRADVIRGAADGLAGIRKATVPPAWKDYSKEFTGPDAAALKSTVQMLDVVFGDGRALTEVRMLALDGKADLTARKAALQTLVEANPPELRDVCEKLLKVRFLNTIALQGLTKTEDPAIGKLIANSFRSFHPSERAAVIAALASRPTYAGELLNQIAEGKIPRNELTAFQARQIRGYDNAELTKKLTAVWGELRDSPKDKQELISKWKADLTPEKIKSANPAIGRAIFDKTCASCHKLFGNGGEIGPDLTGAGRKDLDYLLSNIVDPSAVVNKDFQMTAFALIDGRSLNGIVVAETDRTVTVQTDKDRTTLAKDDIEKRSPSPLSLMPDGLLQPLTPDDIRGLIAYLMADSQVALPK